ncbi:unannotated protein [freshwater metagenome]|uniref:Unannotated protein n=1 Tax=freshwater metagenome TaxID=449393 RepID=A0A6J7JUE1_9ZZZZ
MPVTWIAESTSSDSAAATASECALVPTRTARRCWPEDFRSRALVDSYARRRSPM